MIYALDPSPDEINAGIQSTNSVDRPAVSIGDELGHRVGRHRPRQVEALHPAASEAFQVRKLRLRLDPFGRDLEVERGGHGHDRRDQRRVVRVGAEPVDERERSTFTASTGNRLR